MTEQKRGAVCVGEVLIELARGAEGRFSLSCGGDTFNTAVYLARAGIDVAFASALGDDPYSDSIMALGCRRGRFGKAHFPRARPASRTGLIESGPAWRAQLSLLAREARRRANCSNCPTGCGSPRA